MFTKLISKSVASLVPYPPGKPQEELERELGISNAIKLASNENPLGPSPAALKAVTSALPNLHRYPDASGYYLKKSLAGRLGLDMDQIVLGNGSNEVIELCVRTFMRPGAGVVFSDPTFLMYSKVVQGADGEITRVPLKNHRHDLAGLCAAVTEQTRLVFLDNPNNPTGTLIPAPDLEAFINDLPKTAVLILDEAYYDFVRDERLLDPGIWVEKEHPILFLRTFSKAFGLAGLRVGYGLAHRELVGYLDRVRQPFNVNTLAQIGAEAALRDDDFYQRTRETVWSGLQWLRSELKDMGLSVFPTQTNFFMIDLNRPASDIAHRLLYEGVIARSLAGYGLDDILRVSVGLPEENQRFITALKNVLKDRVWNLPTGS